MNDAVPSMRQRGQWPPIIVVVLLVLFTLANAAANVMPFHRPTAAELQQDAQDTVVAQRRARLVELLADGDHCQPAVAHELAQTLVFDGRSAQAYATDYEQRCAPDPVVHAWGAARIPRRRD